MASGLNGQQFSFVGYLPVDAAGRAKSIKDIEAESIRHNSTQIFIETPYRNNQLIETLLATCRPTTRLCIAANLTSPAEYIRTQTIAQWKISPPPDLHKQPSIFCLLA
jgi:16S rRNA (cytidine1402-2'-O)-methyltransferase